MALHPLARGRVALAGLAGLVTVLVPVLAATSVTSAPLLRTKKAAAPASRGTLAFNRDIRPILSDNCFQCHGPDRAKRMAGLRLDLREEALARKAILPGKPEQSPLLQRVLRTGAGQMPPANAHKQLSATDKAVLRRWIAEGAAYEPHWAFVPLPARVPLPAVKNAAWVRNPIDRFVLARLEAAGLKPNPEAKREDWLRRITLDLTGVPPTPAELDAFLADRSPEAYEKVADRLLASGRYGERMAVPWLDVARYADSYGYQSDQLSPTWPYRDWVVRQFNANLPYDQFITWQVAGDLLPNPTREQRLATAFNRLHRMTNEGGSVSEEWRLEGVADRTHTFGTAFLGLTFECAHCHDHKYDPISQREYYGLSAFFNSIDEYGMYDRADIVPAPSLLLPTPDQERQLTVAVTAAGRSEQSYAQLRTEREGAFQAWLQQVKQQKPQPVLPDETGHFDFEAWEGAKAPNRVPGATAHGARGDEVPLVAGKFGKAAQLDGENNVSFPELGRFTRHTPFTISFWMKSTGTAPEPAVIYQASSGTDAGPHGWDLLLEKGRLTARMFRHWPGNAIAVRSRQEVPKDAWTQVTVTYDGSSRASGLKISLNGGAPDQEMVRDRLYKGIGTHTLVFGQRFRDKGFKGGLLDEVRIFNRALTPVEVGQLFDGKALTTALAAADANGLREYYLSAIDPETRKASGQLAASRQAVWAAEDPQYEIAVMEEMAKPRPAYVLARGQYDAPVTDADRAPRVTPKAVLPFSKELPQDRLGLARWLTRPDHPLTARVAVNRFWALLWGTGLVETVENFGSQGQQPTHPELLDWLSRRFASGGPEEGFQFRNSPKPWDVKSLLKLMVLSATYRQASALRPELKERDPANHLLARGPSHRLSAEAIRDTALFASGLLDERAGGPPVSPYQPGDLWRESNSMSPGYRQSVGGDLYRRSLYTVWKRTAPMPNQLAFDAVSREYCVARRQTTSTPMQALVLLNDPQYVEAARVLGERTVKEGGAGTAERVRYAFRRLASREPSATEAQRLGALYDQQRSYFSSHAEEAAKLVKVGDRKPDAQLPVPEVAAATVLAQAILNLDAVIWKR